MISQYDLIRYAKNKPDCWFRIDNEKDVIDKENEKYICDIKTLTQFFRESMHCDFESVHYCHGTLENTLRCKECGTVIFTHEDEEYDPNLCCPTCGGYETHFTYWTKEEIEADGKKANTIKFLEDWTKEENEAYERRQRRKGKYDSEIWNWTIRGKKHGIKFELKCDNLFKHGLKGLHFRINWMDRDDGGWFIYRKWWEIPLSVSYLKLMIRIHKHNKEKEKC
jgi:uncharacterized Zn finger protein (UPF0148 family)